MSTSNHPGCNGSGHKPGCGHPDSGRSEIGGTDTLFADADVIHAYSRADAIADGALVDHSKMAAEAGFKYPFAMTAAVQDEMVTWTRDDGLQDEEGRAWDVIWMASRAAKRQPGPGEATDRRTFTVHRVPNPGRGRVPRPVQLVLHIGPGDTPEPVMTVMLPNED